MIKCVIFDMDGVLINTEPIHFGIWKQICSERGITLEYDHYAECIGSTLVFLYDLLQKWYGVSFHNDLTVQNRYAELKARHMKEHGIPEVKGAAAAVRKLYEKATFWLSPPPPRRNISITAWKSWGSTSISAV